MAASTQSTLFNNLTYNEDIINNITVGGGNIVFTKDNVIIASEISEMQYRELLKSPYISKIDVLPLKRYGYNYINYQEVDVVSTNQTTIDIKNLNI